MDVHTAVISVPDAGLRAIRVLEEAGHEAWLVGGFVRDALRGAPVHDLDIATAAAWQQAAAAFAQAGYAVHETGTAFGTVTVVVDGSPIEVTTYRSDGDYLDSRHPASVSFVGSIDEDLARRDFTMNAMAYHPVRGLHDPYGGRHDIGQHLIRAVGNAGHRFAEDALRILRGIRFCAQLGYRIDEATLQAMRDQAAGLRAIAAERVFGELDRLLVGGHAGSAIVACPDVLAYVVPEIAAMAGCPQNTPYHIYDVLGHTARVVDASPATPLSRWSALFHDAGKPCCRRTDAAGRDHFLGHAAESARIAEASLVRLKAPSALRADVCMLVANHEWFVPDTDAAVLRALRKFGGRVELYRALLDLQVADQSAKAPDATERLDAARRLQRRLDAVLDAGRPFGLSQLAIGGNDLIAAGWQPGPTLGATLGMLLDAVIDGSLENEPEALLAYASQHRGA